MWEALCEEGVSQLRRPRASEPGDNQGSEVEVRPVAGKRCWEKRGGACWGLTTTIRTSRFILRQGDSTGELFVTNGPCQLEVVMRVKTVLVWGVLIGKYSML